MRSSRRTWLAFSAGAALAQTPAGLCLAGGQFIQAYTDRTSYEPGETIGLSVSTSSPTYTLQVIRVEMPWQVDEPAMIEIPSLPGQLHTNPPDGWLGADWPVDYTLLVPAWPTGHYLAKLIAEDGTFWYYPFFVRPSVAGSVSNIAYVAHFNTINR